MKFGRSRSLILFVSLLIVLPPVGAQVGGGAGGEGALSADAPQARGRVWQMTGPFGGDVAALAVDPRRADHLLLGTHDSQLYRSVDSGRTWKRVRPGLKAPGYSVTALLFDRDREGVVYVGAKQVKDVRDDTLGGGLFRSDDGGENWREIVGLRGRSVRGLEQSAKDPDVIAVVARDGVYRSRDRGATWRRITPDADPELRMFHSVAIDPRDPETVYAGTWHLPWKTTDGGETWKRAGTRETGMIDDSDIFSIHIDAADPDTVLMSACSGIYRSRDASGKWTKLNGIPNTSRRTHVIYQHPTRPEVIFAGTTEGLWRSTDGGKPESWGRVTSLRLIINAIAVHPSRPDRVYLGTEDFGVLVSNDGGESYEPSNAGFISRQVRAVLADRTERGRVYAGVVFDATFGGLFVSQDGGVSWQQSMKGMGVRDVYSLYQSEARPETIYAGTNHGLFRSDDHGRTWAAVRRETEAEKEEAVDPAAAPPAAREPSPVKLIVQKRAKPAAKQVTKPAAKKKAVQSPGKSKGQTARGPRTPKPAPKPAPPPPEFVDLESQVFALVPLKYRGESERTVLLAATWDGLFWTEDEKKGWKELKLSGAGINTSARPLLNIVATSPRAPGVILIGTEEGLFVSRDNGESFGPLPLNGGPHRIKAIAFDPRSAETIYIGTSEAFFRTADGGRSWEQRGGGLPMVSAVNGIAINLLNPDELYVGDYLRGGFYHSRDRGKNWEPLDISSLPSQRLLSLAPDPFDPQRLYAGSFSGGVYVMSKQ